MKLAVMQPYFFPYLGYFQLLHSVDKFMFFDHVQFVRKSWMNRNRLLNIYSKKPYFIRPSLKKPEYKTLLSAVEFKGNEKWEETFLSQLKGYKNQAPFYNEILPLIKKILSFETNLLSEFNINSVIQIARWLDMDVEFDSYSNYSWEYEKAPGRGEWGLYIAKKLKATQYINLPGGESFIKPKKFEENEIQLGFIHPQLVQYNQQNETFTPGLSIIDVLFFNGKEGTLQLLNNYKINWKN